eukprot:610763-Alexandrium_andersonii.AAC.1
MTARAYCDLRTAELTHIGPAGPSCPACYEALRLAGALAAHGSSLSPARREWIRRVIRAYTELILGYV